MPRLSSVIDEKIWTLLRKNQESGFDYALYESIWYGYVGNIVYMQLIERIRNRLFVNVITDIGR